MLLSCVLRYPRSASLPVLCDGPSESCKFQELPKPCEAHPLIPLGGKVGLGIKSYNTVAPTKWTTGSSNPGCSPQLFQTLKNGSFL